MRGVAIAAITTAPVAASGSADWRVAPILLAAWAVAVLGVIDEISPLPALTRLSVQSLAAGGIVLCGLQITLTGELPDGPVTVMWTVAVTNGFALLDRFDRFDRAAVSAAAVTAACLACAALASSQPAHAVLPGALLAALACACLAGRGSRLGPSASPFTGFVLAAAATALTCGRGSGTIVAGLLLPTSIAIAGAAWAARRGAVRDRRRSAPGLAQRSPRPNAKTLSRRTSS
ncbi:MraY family glycosyltransferase [Sphaerimonospora thailandensis]|uniref:Uncharacterized protein n=1 Tax=Sphaerimonospora thailandensis TaxID=795644 RepID=A0A8J3W2I8_9ACTN|nr:hypothetical protein [Sphaerimonospora thailandensis]GIH73263.1 hypothetical protein Mth01_55160 [Sphaerimonospora thailandensis]